MLDNVNFYIVSPLQCEFTRFFFFYLSMLHQLGGTPEVTPIEGVACIPTGDCRQEISKPDYQLACQGIGQPGQGFQDNCQIAREWWSDRETQALGADPGIEPGTSRMLSERSTITPLSLKP